MESLGSSVFKCSFFGAPFVAITDYEGIQCFFDPRLVRGILSLIDIDFETKMQSKLLSADHTVLKEPKVISGLPGVSYRKFDCIEFS